MCFKLKIDRFIIGICLSFAKNFINSGTGEIHDKNVSQKKPIYKKTIISTKTNINHKQKYNKR